MSDLHGWLSGLNPVLQFAALVPFFAAFWLLSRPLAAALIRLVPRAASDRTLANSRHLLGLAIGGLVYWFLDAGKDNLLRLLALAVLVHLLTGVMAKREGVARRAVLALLVSLCLGWLVFLKYGSLLSVSSGWAVPLGISYYVFRMLSYILDVYWGDLSPGSIVEFLHYVLFFSTIIAGPIERMPTFRGQATTPFSADQIESGLQRIIRGAAKKTILSDVVCAFVLGLPFANPDLPTGYALLVLYAYPLRLYWDFSGYSDMAIGAGQMLGFRPPENFDRPFLAQNLQIFWTKWHISLSSWIRDYVYYPILGVRLGRRVPRFWNATTTLASMGLCGLWHGASWSYLWWGLYHGAGLVILSWWQEWRRGREGVRRPWVGVLLTFHFVTAGLWLFFEIGWKMPHAWLLRSLLSGLSSVFP